MIKVKHFNFQYTVLGELGAIMEIAPKVAVQVNIHEVVNATVQHPYTVVCLV